MPKFVIDTPSQSRHELIAQNQEEIDRRNAEIVANEETANNENEQLAKPKLHVWSCLIEEVVVGNCSLCINHHSRGHQLLNQDTPLLRLQPASNAARFWRSLAA